MAPPECCIARAEGSLGGVGQRGLVAFQLEFSPPRRETSEFAGGCGGLAPPARRLVLVPSLSGRLDRPDFCFHASARLLAVGHRANTRPSRSCARSPKRKRGGRQPRGESSRRLRRAPLTARPTEQRMCRGSVLPRLGVIQSRGRLLSREE